MSEENDGAEALVLGTPDTAGLALDPAMEEARNDPGLREDESAGALTKASWRLLPLIGVGYGIAYMDRANIGYAALQMSAAKLVLAANTRRRLRPSSRRSAHPASCSRIDLAPRKGWLAARPGTRSSRRERLASAAMPF